MTIGATVTIDDVTTLTSAEQAALATLLGSTAVSTGTTTTTTNSAPATTNTYPLAMPANVAAGAPVTLGTGPNSIVIYASNNPGGITNQFVVIGNFGTTQVALAGPLTCSVSTGMSQANAQVFTINGDFTGLTSVEIVAAGSGISGLWVDELTVNLIPWWSDQDAVNSRGTGTPSYATLVFNSNGAGETWMPQSAIPAAPATAPVATPSTISGATIGGTAQAANTLAALLTATPAGATLLLPAGTFVGTGAIPNACTVNGSGMGKTIIDGTGITPNQNKALLVPSASGITISNLTLQNSSISASLGNNAAGVRESAAGIAYTLNAVEVTGCQDGMLTFASNITGTGGYTHGNGAGDGLSHEMYFGGDTTNTVSLTNWTSTCGLKSTHALKSRAGTTTLNGGTYTGSGDTTGNVGGSVIDIPDGGAATITGATLVTTAGAANHGFITYGSESNKNATIGSTLMLTNCVFTDNTGSGGTITNGTAIPGATLVLAGCTYTGKTAPAISGFATVTGSIAAAASSSGPTSSAT